MEPVRYSLIYQDSEPVVDSVRSHVPEIVLPLDDESDDDADATWFPFKYSIIPKPLGV